MPKAIGKGRFTTGFLARVQVEKFVLGRPAHRIVAALAHDGLHLAEGTLAGVFAACSALLAPLAELISDRNAAAAHLHVDETSWQVFAAVESGEPADQTAGHSLAGELAPGEQITAVRAWLNHCSKRAMTALVPPGRLVQHLQTHLPGRSW